LLMKNILFFLVVLCVIVSCNRPSKDKDNEEKATSDVITYEVVRTFPHDTQAFTEGLLIHEGKLYESTGHFGTSWIAEVEIATGKQNKRIELPKGYFGEGICILNNKVYQLTYQTHIGFVYDLNTFKKLKEFDYPYEGWGMTTNGKNLLVSDGTDRIHFLDTATLKEVRSLSVKYQNNPLKEINELEWVDGFLYANQWQTNYILKIDPTTGNIVGRMDFNVIAKKVGEAYPEADVLNGIAYEAKTNTWLITGKYWPVMYAVRLRN
jgi:glutamine cyclotransferase